ncbi:hypothetical protein [Endozoicomonas sp. SCSIO W0465]|uniref:hypothetical protein n=1 Tax=Endozoicomonas sp. SCSIO W0465 TaxID=2918516 RepID=UPI0020753485|nr:hypothetical protein [Endozoicomonas sp. SCSIO W0465]USE35736.1 hypothetical protein MJO57_27320 [Endozoicomonas sp. SCSIO W0465]
MKEFYDKRLANYMKKYTKKWGAKLEPVAINFSGSQYPYDTKPDTVWSVIVTESGKGRSFSSPPHSTRHAGPHRAVQR